VIAAVPRLVRRLPSIDPRIADGVLVLALVTGQVYEFTQSSYSLGHLVAALGVSVPLLWRRRFPIAVMVVQSLGSALFLAPPFITSLLANFIGVYSGGLYSRHRALSLAIPVLGAALLAVFGIPGHFYTQPVPAWLALLVPGVGLWLAGGTVRGLQERARRLEHERELAARLAAAEERARIARELHDVVAHSVSVMVVQAGAARTQVSRDDEAAAGALRAVEAGGREALAELRNLLGALSEGRQPGLAQLGELVERMRGTGLPVEVTTEGTPRPLTPDADLAAYRVVQEALTNTLKHAAGAPAQVVLRYRERELQIDVVDAGGVPAAGTGGSGQGLRGIRDRLTALGGEVEAAAQPGGGFAVRARLPLEYGSSSWM
jgi:signal transduction histidine kinase